jgi:hypothetical protein
MQFANRPHFTRFHQGLKSGSGPDRGFKSSLCPANSLWRIAQFPKISRRACLRIGAPEAAAVRSEDMNREYISDVEQGKREAGINRKNEHFRVWNGSQELAATEARICRLKAARRRRDCLVATPFTRMPIFRA